MNRVRVIGDRLPPVLRRLIQYGLTAGVAAVVDVGGFALLLPAGVPLVPAATISFLLANVVNYRLTASFVFGTAPSLRRYPKFLGAAAAGLVVNVGVTALAAGMLGLAPVAAKVVGVGVAFFANFALNALIVFPSTGPEEPSGAKGRTAPR
ncbi:GtrA family protein [Cereibacter sphaeroides]|uniref:GtrA family protein n=1 Tax=Cereibacter sphaeroides TaxID=1063 RepID=UPI001F2604B6|nr:GtrA family protein [Cereibacter sphaeroides]MCE6968671.1 GtrA family protein [Cereibacter sphaeroides]